MNLCLSHLNVNASSLKGWQMLSIVNKKIFMTFSMQSGNNIMLLPSCKARILGFFSMSNTDLYELNVTLESKKILKCIGSVLIHLRSFAFQIH